MNNPTLEELLGNGVHFGHRSSRWHPRMEPYIFTTRNKIHVINLEKTLEKLKEAMEFVRKTAAAGGTVLFVGTKRQAKDIVRKAAESCGMPYVTIRWLGGTFTNFKTIQKTVRKLDNLQRLRDSEDFEKRYVKKERLIIEREIEKLKNLFEGFRSLKKLPEAIYAADINHDQIAVREARGTGIKVVGLVDTNSDPDEVDFPIPANDDAIKSIDYITGLIASAVKEGRDNPVHPAPAEAAPAKEKKDDKS